MRIRLIITAALAILPAPSVAQSRDLVSPVLEFVEAELERQGIKDAWQGPLILDVASFVAAANAGAGERVSASQVAGAANRELRPGMREDAVRCVASPNPRITRNCFVVDRGLYVRFDSIRKTRAAGYSVTVTYQVTDDRRAGRLATFTHQLQLTFLREDGALRLQNVMPLRIS